MTLLTVSGRRRTSPPPIPDPTTPPTVTYTAGETILVIDELYNSFPGVVTCPNGDVLAAYRTGATHTSGGNVMTMRSTNGGIAWSSPTAALTADETYWWSTANLSRVGSRIALVTWLRPVNTYALVVNGVRVVFSDDNGLTWGPPITVDTEGRMTGGVASESSIVYRDGFYYICVYGFDIGDIGRTEILRTSDLVSWTRVARFDGGTSEADISTFGDYMVCVIRNSTTGIWSSISVDGRNWTTPVLQHPGTHGAPKMSADNFHDTNLILLREKPSNYGIMCAVDSAGTVTTLNTLMTGMFMYGQTYQTSATTGGVIYAKEGPSGSPCRIMHRPFTATAP